MEEKLSAARTKKKKKSHFYAYTYVRTYILEQLWKIKWRETPQQPEVAVAWASPKTLQ